MSEIRKYGDTVLREKAVPVEKVNGRIKALADDMIAMMRAERGVGLAAQQVGRTEKICVIEAPVEYDTDEQGARYNPDVKMPLVLVNPEITEFSDETLTADEGCLSFPGIYAPVERSAEITVKFVDLENKPQTLHLKQFIARIVQHEVDHLNGILLVDRMSALKKIALSGQLKRLRKETLEQLAETGG